MEIEQAYDFVNKLLNCLVVKTDIPALPQFYHQDVIGHYGDILFNFSDIENRARYLKEVYKDRSHILHECVVADDKLVFRDRQIMTHIKTNELWVSEVTGIYSIKNNLVSELWLMTNQDMNYRETPDYALKNRVPSEDDSSLKKHFITLITSEKFSIHGKLQTVNLTNREFDVLFYTMRGMTAKEIGSRINISFRTVETYLETLKTKFDCHTKAELRRKIAPGAVWL